MAISSDNVTLNVGIGGAVIHTEDNPTGAQRGDPNLPLTDYEMPASKLHTGPYGLDQGPVTRANPLPVAAAELRQLEESQFIASLDAAAHALVTRGEDRCNPISGRGGR